MLIFLSWQLLLSEVGGVYEGEAVELLTPDISKD